MIDYKRRLKRKYLIKKLFSNIAKKENLENIFLTIQENIRPKSCFIIFYNYQDKAKIFLNLANIKLKTKEGYSNGYYEGRHNILNFVKNNYKLSLYFVLFHEIGHFVNYRLNQNSSEMQADIYAINKLKEYNLLKENKRHIDDWSIDSHEL